MQSGKYEKADRAIAKMKRRQSEFLQEVTFLQTSANNSTGYRYSKITRKSAIIRSQIPGLLGSVTRLKLYSNCQKKGLILASIIISMCENLGIRANLSQAKNQDSCEHNLGFSLSSFDLTQEPEV